MIKVPQRSSVSRNASAPVLRPDLDDLIANQNLIIEKIQISILNGDDNNSDLVRLADQIELLERLQRTKVNSAVDSAIQKGNVMNYGIPVSGIKRHRLLD